MQKNKHIELVAAFMNMVGMVLIPVLFVSFAFTYLTDVLWGTQGQFFLIINAILLVISTFFFYISYHIKQRQKWAYIAGIILLLGFSLNSLYSIVYSFSYLGLSAYLEDSLGVMMQVMFIIASYGSMRVLIDAYRSY